VIGLLNSDGTIDAQRSGVLVEMARPLSVTFHRAFDMASDPTRALDALIGLGIDRVLTSGQEFSALEGLGLITDLVRQAGGRLIVMPGGEINEENVAQVVEQSGVREVHVSARSAVQSRMVYRNPRCAMGSEYHPDEYAWKTADASRVRALVEAIA
jgi:copper homeostasis protein